MSDRVIQFHTDLRVHSLHELHLPTTISKEMYVKIDSNQQKIEPISAENVDKTILFKS